jgi:hypothetical protein
MSACATVADVLALTPDPRLLSCAAIRRAFGIGHQRARVIRALAIEAAKARDIAGLVMREYGMSEAEARDFVAMGAAA